MIKRRTPQAGTPEQEPIGRKATAKKYAAQFFLILKVKKKGNLINRETGSETKLPYNNVCWEALPDLHCDSCHGNTNKVLRDNKPAARIAAPFQIF